MSYLLSDAGKGLGLVQAPSYQSEPSLSTGDLLLEPRPHRVCEVDCFPTEMNSRQAAHTFEVLDHMSVVCGVANLPDAEKVCAVAGQKLSGSEESSCCKGASARHLRQSARFSPKSTCAVAGIALT
jgi:hypothetical protein